MVGFHIPGGDRTSTRFPIMHFEPCVLATLTAGPVTLQNILIRWKSNAVSTGAIACSYTLSTKSAVKVRSHYFTSNWSDGFYGLTLGFTRPVSAVL
jgi:hypothetical protein